VRHKANLQGRRLKEMTLTSAEEVNYLRENEPFIRKQV